MQEFYLNDFLNIPGISSASGIEFLEGQIYIVSDNSNYLYDYRITENLLNRHVLLQSPQMERIAKPLKLDLEAMVLTDDRIYTFGSGSTAVRERGFSISRNDWSTTELDMGNLYSAMKKSANISSSDFNIEGVAMHGNSWLFLNRGNGPAGRNVIFKVDGDDLINDFVITCFDINLPQIDGLLFGFSGASVVDDTLYFIATAEEGLSTYEDGEIGGTVFGKFDLINMRMDHCQKISNDQKFEGITYYELQPDMISFLLCEDSDGSSDLTTIYRLDFNLP
ncbi:Uncharacterised protein [Sphingobacterium mizutaii]|uniref:Uncharacterized protein n=2 Tax=Sphingobacterium mizutaii TaxID=1010 RepID=A0AAJ4XBR0_9SPHI|nr:hypothetical protein [Sphingobacterium mizutaii]SDK92709.1 hypothetical protein SAMN05192578_101367 [Sphingobacterium mizutaii]SNV48085.1 Uncharacterised protein [Sphingobacterium mizutaii]